MRKIIAILLAVFTFVFLGCSTKIKVQKVDDFDSKTEGVRYYLPQPFLLISPKNDGGVDVSVEYLPDYDNQYAVQVETRLAAHTLEVAIDNGFLTKVTYSPDDSGVASQMVDTAGNLAKAQLEADAAAEKAAAEAAEKEREKEELKKKEFDDAEKEFKIAEEELVKLKILLDKQVANNIISEDKKNELLAAAENKEAVARAKRDAIKSHLNGSAPASGNTTGGSGNVARGASAPWDGPEAWGPVLLQIVEDDNLGVRLKPVGDHQELFRTSMPLKKPDPGPKPPTFGFGPGGRVVPQQNGNKLLIVIPSANIEDVTSSRAKVFDVNGNEVIVTDRPAISLIVGDRQEIEVNFSKLPLPGVDYRIEFEYKWRGEVIAGNIEGIEFRVESP